MIPSSPRRTWQFLLVSSLALFAPDLLVPDSWSNNPTYLLLSNAYQGLLVLVGFWFGPAICQAMIVDEVKAGPLRHAIDNALASLQPQTGLGVKKSPVTLAEHAVPFVITAGLFPQRSAVFLSSAQVLQLGPAGLRFLLARALVHATWSQRLGGLLPVLIVTVLVPGVPKRIGDWLGLGAFLCGWLLLHWYLELRVDREAAALMGKQAWAGFNELQLATASAKFSLQPPLRWRIRQLAAKGMR